MRRVVLFICVLFLFSCQSCENHYTCERSICMPGNCLYNGQCVQIVGNICTENSDCLSNICLRDAQKDYGYCTYNCIGDNDCPQKYRCLGNPRMCIYSQEKEGCESNLDCGICGNCIGGSCASDYGCPYYLCSTVVDCPYCMTCIGGMCVPIDGCRGSMCSDNEDCGGCAICVDGLCKNPEGCKYPPCKNDNECPPGYYCNTNSGECKKKGVSEVGKACSPDIDGGYSDIGDDLSCESGLCIYDDGSYYCSIDCTSDNSICPYNYTCSVYSNNMRVCKKKKEVYTGIPCKNDSDCNSKNNEVCIFVMDSQNSAGTYCSQPFSDGFGLGYVCEQHGDCNTNLCPDNKICSKPCDRDKDCPRGYVCEELPFKINENIVELKGCVARYYTYGRIGDICNDNMPCRKGLFCMSDNIKAPSPICTKECSTDSDCIDNYECRKDDIYDSSKTLCLPIIQPYNCIYDSDCPSDKVCSLFVNENKEYSIDCVDKNEGNAPLEKCSFSTGNPSCSNNMCTFYNYCDSLCMYSYDCQKDYLRCDLSVLKMPDSSLRFNKACRLKYGSLKSCTTDKDCESKEVCRRFISFDGLYEKNACMTPIPEGLPFGSSCNPQTLEPKCINDLCSDDAICTKFCLSDSDCGSNMKCDVTHSRLSNGGELYFMGCRPDKKRGGLGDPCPSGWLDCEYNLFCYNDGEVSFCTKACNINNPQDCAPPDNICKEINQNYICAPKSY